jgi:chitodextrinase
MRKRIETPVPAVLLALFALGSNIPDSYARGGADFGPAVDSACQAFNGTTPFSDQSCALCHNTSDLGQRIDPQWGWWETGNLTAFCPEPPNQAPDGTIDAPPGNLTITVGDSVNFMGTANDPDGNLPLSFDWSFGGGAPDGSVKDPGSVTFNTVGTFTVIFTVTDSLGLSDPTPDSRTITVNDVPPPGQAPSGVIDTPASDLTVTAGDTVGFAGTASDPDGDLPLTFDWNFGGGASNVNVEDPGSVLFSAAGTFTVTFTVTDSLGSSDPTPDARTITVSEPAPSCTDLDNDGFATEGGSCGPVDCNDGEPSVNPDAAEICTDGIDNNCNGLTDAADPTAVDCPISGVCMDNDGDRFSSDGGICGPIDCDDFDKAVNPGATEACGDDIDNDCDGAIDIADPECNGGDCLGQLFNGQDAPVSITHADWNPDNLRLRIRGDKATADASVTLTNAETGVAIGVTPVQEDGKWRSETFNPETVPCRVRVIIGKQSAEQDIENAPANCNGSEDDIAGFRLKKAEWNSENSRLRAGGDKSLPGAEVIISNAATGNDLGTVIVKADGKWRYEAIISDPGSVPCSVRVEINGQVATKDVKNAPANCKDDDRDDEEGGERDDDKDDDRNDEEGGDRDDDKDDDRDDEKRGARDKGKDNDRDDEEDDESEDEEDDD